MVTHGHVLRSYGCLATKMVAQSGAPAFAPRHCGTPLSRYHLWYLAFPSEFAAAQSQCLAAELKPACRSIQIQIFIHLQSPLSDMEHASEIVHGVQ